jgi:hypothetical protein
MADEQISSPAFADLEGRWEGKWTASGTASHGDCTITFKITDNGMKVFFNADKYGIYRFVSKVTISDTGIIHEERTRRSDEFKLYKQANGQLILKGSYTIFRQGGMGTAVMNSMTLTKIH